MSDEWAHFEDKVEAKGYAQISNALLRDPRISLQAKGFYALLKSYAWQDPTTFPGVKRLRSDTGASDNTLKKYRGELIEAKLLEVKRRGRGQTNLYVFKSVAAFLESHTGAKLESHTGAKLESHTGANNEDAVDEDAVNNSRRGAEAPNPMENLFTYYCHLANAMGLDIFPEDREQTAGNFAALLRKHEPGRETRIRVVSKMLEARTAGVSLSPQKAYEKIMFGNVHQLRTNPEQARPKKRVL